MGRGNQALEVVGGLIEQEVVDGRCPACDGLVVSAVLNNDPGIKGAVFWRSAGGVGARPRLPVNAYAGTHDICTVCSWSRERYRLGYDWVQYDDLIANDLFDKTLNRIVAARVEASMSVSLFGKP